MAPTKKKNSKSQPKRKSTVHAVCGGGLPRHPALSGGDPLLGIRLGSEAPARIPDTYNAPTGATVLRHDYMITTDSDGNFVEGILPSLVNSRYVYGLATDTGGVISTSSTTSAVFAHPQAAIFRAEAARARMVALKVVVSYIGRADEESGFLSAGEYMNQADLWGKPFDSLTDHSPIEVTPRDGMVLYGSFRQEPRFENPDGTTFMHVTHALLAIFGRGLPPNKACVRVRTLRYMEYLPEQGALSEGELVHEPHHPGAMAAHGELAGPGTSFHKESETKHFQTVVRDVANAAYHMAVPFGQYVGGQARKYLMNNAGAIATSGLALLMA